MYLKERGKSCAKFREPGHILLKKVLFSISLTQTDLVIDEVNCRLLICLEKRVPLKEDLHAYRIPRSPPSPLFDLE
jgi:hypothetical protein